MSRLRENAGPWKASGPAVVGVVNGAAAVAVAVCWLGAAHQVVWHDGLSWLQAAIVVAVVASTANASWLLTGMRRLRERRIELLTAFRPTVLTPTDDSSTAVGVFVTARRMTSYHVPTCLLVQGKEVEPVKRIDGLTACGMCLR